VLRVLLVKQQTAAYIDTNIILSTTELFTTQSQFVYS